jgi:hypothetical protein
MQYLFVYDMALRYRRFETTYCSHLEGFDFGNRIPSELTPHSKSSDTPFIINQ